MPESDSGPDLSEYPASARFVYRQLTEIEPATSREVAEAAQMELVNARHYLTELRKDDIVTRRRSLAGDARQFLYES